MSAVDSMAASAFDGRLVEVDIAFPEGSPYTFDQNFMIKATGTKFASANQASCELTIYNLTRTLRQELITACSPLGNRDNLPTVSLKIGRVSTGSFLLYVGNVISANLTQPPDIGMTFRALTNNALLGAIAATQQPALSSLNTISQQVADLGKLTLDYQATNKNISNFSYLGNPLDGVSKINDCGGVLAYCDNQTLVVLDSGKPRISPPRVLSQSTGMVGIPQITEQGVVVTMMADNSIVLGGQITIQSELNPAANGTWFIIRIDYDVSSREQQFFYTLLCSRLAYYTGDEG